MDHRWHGWHSCPACHFVMHPALWLALEEDGERGIVPAPVTTDADEYLRLFGKKPHHRMKPETVRAKINGYAG